MSEKEESKPESDSRICPTCHENIPGDAPGGICPKCALAEAASPPEAGTYPMPGRLFEPPPLETIAKAFPYLEIIDLIGCGGMGAVYQARQPNLDRLVALKILPPSLAKSPEFKERFSREGRLLAKLSHPNIVGIYDFGECGGFFFLLMEFVDGVNLRQAMRAGRFTPEQALGIVPEICEALQFAHDEGILHRDIKPENILMDAKGRIKIADFGIAKLVGEGGAAEFALTGTAMPGTPQYMAPEQIEHPGDVDHRADIFSLGVVFYEMLTGELPMGRFSAPSEKTAVDSQVDEIVFRSLEKERDRRQQSAGQVKTEIENRSVAELARMRHPGYGIPAGGPTPTVSSGGTKAAVFVITGLVLLLFVVSFSFFVIEASAVKVSRSRVQQEIAKTEAKRDLAILTQDIVEMEARLSMDPDDESVLQQLSLKKEQFLRDSRLFEERKRTTVTPRSSFLATVGPFIIIVLLLIVMGIPGTIMGWKSLHRIRVLGLKESRAPAMFAALFWPMVLSACGLAALIALPMSSGPRWISGLGFSLTLVAIVFLGWLITKKVRTWMDTPATNSEKALALSKLSVPENPWPQRILWLLLALFITPVLLVSFWSFNAPVGYPEMLVIAGIVFFFFYIIRRLIRPRRLEVPPKSAAPAQQSPWPRRIFWLIVMIFILPAVMILVGLVLPYFALEKAPAKSHVVKIQDVVEGRKTVVVNILTRRYGKGNVNFKVRQEYPESLLKPVGDLGMDSGTELSGVPVEWNLYDGKDSQSTRITFGFPDQRTATMATKSIRLISISPPWDLSDTDQIELFDIPFPKGEKWRGWIEIESDILPVVGKP